MRPPSLRRAKPGIPEELMGLLGGQAPSPGIGVPNAPIPSMGPAPAEKELRQAELSRELFDLARTLKMNPGQSEVLEQIAAAFEQFGRSM